ncbi:MULTISPECIES: hypothetical protein [unclassified Moorena]|nr:MULTISPECIES: hypothetical protein [unclassified Moorena]
MVKTTWPSLQDLVKKSDRISAEAEAVGHALRTLHRVRVGAL